MYKLYRRVDARDLAGLRSGIPKHQDVLKPGSNLCRIVAWIKGSFSAAETDCARQRYMTIYGSENLAA